MPPKPKETAKKPAPQVVRPPISNSSLVFVPDDVIEGFQERIETGIDWTLLEQAARHHRHRCLKEGISPKTFSGSLQNKIDNSILSGFLKEDSTLTLEEQWELLLPITLWDNEKFANEEGKICFKNANNITDDMLKLIKKAVMLKDRNVLKNDIKMVNILRVNGAEMTNLDKGLLDFKKLVTLNLCGNFIESVDATFIPPSVKTIELQNNRIKSIEAFAEYLSPDLIYLGLARNLLRNDSVDALALVPHHISVLDLSDNDIYDLDPLLDALVQLPNLASLYLAGNPCSVCAGYARTTLMRLQRLKWLDCRQVLPTDRSVEPFEPHPDDLRSAYFTFTVFRVMSVLQPPKPDKGAITTFHIELEIPMLDSTRRRFLMYRRNESLIELLPPPEDDQWPPQKVPSTDINSRDLVDDEASSHESDIYKALTTKNSREICNFTTFESNRVQWNKVMNFQEPAIKIFCPDLFALRDTFRTVITVKLVYSLVGKSALKKLKKTTTAKPPKDKKSALSFKPPGEQRVVLATMKCALRTPDWSQPSQHFHWDDSLGTNDAIHWGDGDLSVLQYSQAPVKAMKGKPETDAGASRQLPPDNLTCHFGFGIDTLRA